jgi:thioesterase domain-containing protein
MATQDPAAALTEYLHREIPAARAMDIRVVELTPERARLTAPFAPNANDHGSAFGGSVASIAILAGWAWVHDHLRREGLHVGSVLRGSELKFRAPAAGDLEAITALPEPREVARFLRGLRKFGRGRVSVPTEVRCGGELVAEHRGDYAAGVEAAVERP